MFIWTAKINRKKILLTLAAVLCVSAAVFTLSWSRGATVSASVSPKGVKTEEDRVAYLQGWGWLVSPQAVLVEELELPKELGTEYAQYLELQTQQGFDLNKYAGKRVRRYSYEILNYPGGQTEAVAHLLLYKNTVIAGEVLGDGFLHGLEMPK